MLSDTESTADERHDLLAKFAAAVVSLAEGELTFKPPFDLSSSAALADNIDTGVIAEKLFDVTALRDMAFTVSIHEHSLRHPELPGREVIDTRVDSARLLVALLEGFLDEIYARHDE